MNLRDVMTDDKFHELSLPAQAEVMRRVGATDDQISNWVGMASARTGAPIISQRTGPERPLSAEQQTELDAAAKARKTRLRRTGYSEGNADLQDWKTMGKGIAFAAAPSIAAPLAVRALQAAAPLVASRAPGAYEGFREGRKVARSVGAPESLGGVAGAAAGALAPSAAIVGGTADELGSAFGGPAAGIPAALMALYARHMFGGILGKMVEAALARGGSTVKGAAEAAPAVEAAAAPASRVFRVLRSLGRTPGAAESAAPETAPAVAKAAEPLVRLPLRPVPAPVPAAPGPVISTAIDTGAAAGAPASQALIVQRLRQLAQMPGGAKAVRDAAERVFGDKADEVLLQISQMGTRIPTRITQ